MKRILIVLAVSGLCGIANAQVGDWEVQIKRTGGVNDVGTGYITISGNGTISGYSLTSRAFGISTYNGTWSTGATGSILVNFTETLNGQSFPGTIVGKFTSKSLKGKATFNDGRIFSLKGKPVSSMLDGSGNWSGTVKEAGHTVVESFTTTSNPNFAGVCDFTGLIGGSLTGTGQVIIASSGALSGYSVTETGGGLIATVTGKVNPSNGSLATKGIDENGVKLTGKFFKH